MTQRTSRLLLAAVAVTLLGSVAVRADLGPFPRNRDRPFPTPCRVVPIRSVEKVVVSVMPSLRVRALGTTTTAGWTAPELRLVQDIGVGRPTRNRVYEFVACRPVALAAQRLTVAVAEAMLPAMPDNIWRGRIVVKAERNSRTLDTSAMPGR